MLKVIVTLGICFGVADCARADVRIEVLATFPAGNDVSLGKGQNFYLRLGYHTDQPVRIWVNPFFEGQPVAAGTSPSSTYTGAGEMLAWFFFQKPWEQVDEVRIRAGDGSTSGTHDVATFPVHIGVYDRPEATTGKPDWVVEMTKAAEIARQEENKARMNTPISVGDSALFGGFMLLMLVLGVFGFAAPAWAIWRWRGGWRIAAIVPAIMMGLVVVRLMFDTSRDPTSHNLWPFEIVMTGGLSVLVMIVLSIARRFYKPERREAER
ncbi:MAG: hypothetical protein ABI451_09290 [Dokdonella sp.]